MESKRPVQSKAYVIRDGRSILSEVQDLEPTPSAAAMRFLVGVGVAKDGLNLRIAMPAVLDEDFAFRLEDRALFIFGTRCRPEGFGEVKKFALRYGDFEQRIPLPAGLSVQRAKGHFHHGVLDLHIPFKPDSASGSVSGDFTGGVCAESGMSKSNGETQNGGDGRST